MYEEVVTLSQEVLHAHKAFAEAQIRLENAITKLSLCRMIVETHHTPDGENNPVEEASTDVSADDTPPDRGGPRNQVFPVYRPGDQRESRTRKGAKTTERFYRSALYAAVGSKLGVGTRQSYLSASGKRHRGIWLSENERGPVCALCSEIAAKYK